MRSSVSSSFKECKPEERNKLPVCMKLRKNKPSLLLSTSTLLQDSREKSMWTILRAKGIIREANRCWTRISTTINLSRGLTRDSQQVTTEIHPRGENQSLKTEDTWKKRHPWVILLSITRTRKWPKKPRREQATFLLTTFLEAKRTSKDSQRCRTSSLRAIPSNSLLKLNNRSVFSKLSLTVKTSRKSKSLTLTTPMSLSSNSESSSTWARAPSKDYSTKFKSNWLPRENEENALEFKVMENDEKTTIHI